MNRSKRLAGIVLSGILGTSVFAASATTDWNQFHGPQRDNISHETGLLKEWPEAGPPLVWKGTGIGAGYSSVVVSGGKVFTAGDMADKSVYLFALNESDGKVAWKAKVSGIPSNLNHPGVRSTPTVDGDFVYMLGQFGDLVCFKASDGSEIWRKSLNKELGGKIMSGWGSSESILIDGDHIICTPGGTQGTLAALDKKDGSLVWRSGGITDAAAYMAPVIAEIGGVRQAVVLTGQHVAGISLTDGKVLWKADRPGKTAVIPDPVIKDNYVYVTSGYGVGCSLFKVSGSLGEGKFSAEKVYSNTVMVNHHGGIIQLDGLVYGYSDGGNGWTCQEMVSGEAKWKDRALLGKGTISYADGRFYLRAEKTGELILLDANGDHHIVKGRFQQPERSADPAWAHLVIANGHLYVRDNDKLFVYDVKNK